MSASASRRRMFSVIAAALFFGILLEVPQWLHMRDARYRGIPVMLNSDEPVYVARVEEALTGRPEQSAEAIVGDARLRGTQPAMLERVVGTLFAPTGWRAPAVLQVMDFVVGAMFFLALFWFLRLCGFAHIPAFIGTTGFSLLELYNLNRPIHQGLSAILILLALNCLMSGMEGRAWKGMIGGALLGATFGDYFWSWSYAWLWVFLVVLWVFIDGVRHRRWDALRRIALFLGVGLIVALPFVIKAVMLTRDPLYAQAVFRSGMHPSHMPESWIYSGLFAMMGLGVIATLQLHPSRCRRYGFAIITVMTSLLAIHQQVLHGLVFNFVSHYLLLLGITAVCVLLLWHALRFPSLALAALAAVVYLAALAYDGRFVINQWTVTASRFHQQHLSSLLPVLDTLPRSMILSDPATQFWISSSTKHDVVYSLYLKNLLMTHQEIAERFCLTQVPVNAADRDLAHAQAIYPDADSAFSDDKNVPERETRMLQTACANADKHPRAVLQQFHVDYILWDQQGKPQWDVRTFRTPLTTVASGDGWTLFKVSVR